MKIKIKCCGCCLVIVLVVIAWAILFAHLASHGNFAGGIFQEPYTGGWLLCIAGKCWPLP